MRLREVRRLHCGKREGRPNILASLARIAAKRPEHHERNLILDGEEPVGSPGERKIDAGTQVVEIGLQAPCPRRLLGSLQGLPRGLCQRKEVVAMPDGRRSGVIALVEVLAREVANRFQLPIARRVLVDHHQRLVDERGQQIENIVRRQRVGATNCLGGLDVESADEDAEAFEQPLLGLLQQIVRPRDQRAQRLLALQQYATAAGQQLEAILQPLVDVVDGQRAHPRSGELQRERNALEARDEFGHRGRFLLGQRESRLLQLCPVHEKLHRCRTRQRFDAGRPVRHRQRKHGIGLLAGHPQRFAAGRDNPDIWCRSQQRIGERRGGADQVLAVVENQEQLARFQIRAERLGERPPRLFLHAEDLGGDARNQRVVADRRKVDEPDTVRIRIHHVSRDLQ